MPEPQRTWLDAVRGTSVLAVATALGLKTSPPRGASGGSVYGCPACGQERRHALRRDRRGALGVRANGLGFRCMDCDIGGDAVDLVALVLRGKRFPDLGGVGKDEVRQWFEQFAVLEPRPARTPTPVPTPALVYPPEGELRTFWDACEPVSSDAAAANYLGHRRISAINVDTLQLARVLPSGVSVPDWAGRWRVGDHRLIVPLYDHAGLMRSCLARSVRADAGIKSIAPSGYSRAGLVMACGFGRWLLATGRLPEWWGERELKVVVAEGEIDFLTAATEWSDAAEHAPATLGVVSGSWCDAIAERVPPGSTVVIATDPDAAGEKYAAAITQSLMGRDVCLKRWEPTA